MDADAVAGAVGEGVGELLADVTFPVDEGFEGDGAACGTNGGEHGGEDLVAVAEGGDAVAGEDGRAEKIAEGLLEGGGIDGVTVIEFIGDGLRT